MKFTVALLVITALLGCAPKKKPVVIVIPAPTITPQVPYVDNKNPFIMEQS